VKDPLTKDEVERAHVRLLRQAVPVIPEGWEANPDGIVRLSGLDKPGTFAASFVSGPLRLVFVMLPEGSVQYSLSRRDACVTKLDTARVCLAWFAGTEVEATSPLQGLVFFDVKTSPEAPRA
jgi:hypothetical protein